VRLSYPAAARIRLIDLFTGWNSRITALIAACDDTILPRSIATLPVGLTWPSTVGVTLLGDAAHLMPPVGQGANMAMLDGALLGLALAAHTDDFPAAVKEYEREMFERTSAAARQSAHMLRGADRGQPRRAVQNLQPLQQARVGGLELDRVPVRLEPRRVPRARV